MGLFSNLYTKEGKGVEKNAPQKKSFFRFFELYGRNFSKLITGNMLYILLCTPIFTIGLAEAGLTYICRSVARDQHTFATSDFFETVKKNWKQSLIVGIVDILAFAVLGYDIYFAYMNLAAEQSLLNKLYFGLTAVMALLYWFSGFYRYFMIITFKLKLSKIYKNSFIYAFSAIGPNLLIAIITAAFIVSGYFMFTLGAIGWIIIVVFVFLLYPAFHCFLKQYCIFPIIRKTMIDPYYEQHPDDDILLRRRLGLLPPEEDDFDYSSIKEETNTNE